MKPTYQTHIFLTIAIVSAVYIIVSGPIFIPYLPVLLSQTFGILLILWAFLSIKLNKHHADTHKLPEGYFLVTKGPYEIIRHPIYAGILLIMSGFVQGGPELLRYVVFVLFFIALIMKMMHEERVLEKHIKDYMPYKKKTHKLIPYFY